MSTMLRLSRMHYPVRVLGFGTRIGVWTQGCSIGCEGCVSRDTWDARGGVEASVEEVVDSCRRWAEANGPLDGVTISGGEPFDQPEALLQLLQAIDVWLGNRRATTDVLCYSGYPQRRLEERHPDILARLDVLIPNPYVASRAPGGRWRGSSNQLVVPLSDLGRKRYSAVASQTEQPAEPEIQFVVDNGIWFIGIPRPGDMEILEQKLRSRGIKLGTASWR